MTEREPTTIDVVRSSPPNVGRCRAKECGKPIEWVRTFKNNKLMPVDSPLVVVRVHERSGAAPVTVIYSSASHFATCAEVKKFRL